MAQLAVAGGGAAIGAALGSVIPGAGTLLGAQIGWALGGVAGALVFPPKGQDAQGPRLTDLSVQTSGYGLPIPTAVGRVKLAGNVIWKTAIEEKATRRRQGKGGRRPTTTTYSYTLSWAVGLCEWLMPTDSAQVLKIWLDDKLVYDTTGDSAVIQVPGLLWRFYPGSETQLPDPLITATEGAADAPAHRGLAYIVFEDVPLEKFGNRMPNVTVELASSTLRSFTDEPTIPPIAPLWPSVPSSRTYISSFALNVAVDYRRGRIYEGRVRMGTPGGGANEMIRVYDLITLETLSEHPLDRILGPLFPPGSTPGPASTGTGLMHLAVDGYLYVTGGDVNRVPMFKIDPDAMRGVGVFGSPLGDGFGFGDVGTRLVNPMAITSLSVPRAGGEARTLVVVQGSYSAFLTIDAATMSHVWGASDVSISPPPINPALGIGPLTFPIQLVPGEQRAEGSDLWYLRASELGTPFRIDVTRITYGPGAANLGGGVAAGITRTDFAPIDVLAEIDPLITRPLLQGAWWDASDNTLVITLSGTGGPLSGWGRFSTVKWAPGAGIVWTVVDHVLPTFHDGRGQISRVLGSSWGLGGNLLLQAGSGTVLLNQAGASFNSLFWLDEQQAVLGYRIADVGAHEIARRALTRAAPETLALGDVVQALCSRAGLEAADVNVAALTDPLRGYILPRPVSARDAITPLASAFQIDAVEQDDVLLFRRRAGPIVASIPYDGLVREDQDGPVLGEQRAQDAELPRELTVRFLDIDRSYEQNAQSWRRPVSPTATMGAAGSSAIDLPIPLAAAEGKAIARRLITATWRERTRLTFGLGPRHARLVPTDPVTLTTRDGTSLRCRILSTQLGANWVTRVEAVTEDAASYALTAPAEGGAGWAAPAMPVPYFTRLVLPDLTLVTDADDLGQQGLREYAFACAYQGSHWRGVRLVRSPDQTAWTEIGTALDSGSWGAVVEMPAAPRSPWVWDETGALVVRMQDGAPESATGAEVLSWANMAALVAPDGSAEIIQWRDALDQGEGLFRLTGLLRGRRGTEDLIASRTAGDLFLILDATRLAFSALASEATASRYHRAVSVFETVETAAATITKPRRGRAEQPYAPVHITGSRDGPGNLTIGWTRRTRLGGDWQDGSDIVPLGEVIEAYAVDILAGLPAAYAPSYDASTTLGPGYVVINAFDGETASFPWASDFGVASAWIRVTYRQPLRLARYAIQARNDGYLDQTPRDWTFEGWTGSAWAVLDTRTGQTGWTVGQIRSFDVAADRLGSFTAYRLNMTAHNGGGVFAIEQLMLYLAATAGPNVARVTEGVVRTISTTSPTAVYSPADQTTDWGGPAGAVLVRIQQISSSVGRGIAAEAIL